MLLKLKKLCNIPCAQAEMLSPQIGKRVHWVFPQVTHSHLEL